VAVLIESLHAGEIGAGGVTNGHPRIAGGMMRWFETVARLRMQLNELGWQSTDPKGSPRITSPDGRVTLMVAGGDPDTGSHEPIHPRFAHPKGSATEDAVAGNQMVLPFPTSREPSLIPVPSADGSTWVLLYCRCSDPAEVRAELSYPTQFVGGEVENWRTRIVLPSLPMEAVPVPQNAGGPDDDVQFEIHER
jgi:hypothetical protein